MTIVIILLTVISVQLTGLNLCVQSIRDIIRDRLPFRAP